MPGRKSAKDQPGAGQRLDRWLWFARFYKTRSLATAAASGGRVHVNGERAKAARAVSPGDRLDITLEEGLMTVDVLALPVRRGPAPEAQACYQETPESAEARALLREKRRWAGPGHNGPGRRPDKRERRDLRRLQGRGT